MPRAIGNVGEKTLCQKKMRMLRSTMGTPRDNDKDIGNNTKSTSSVSHNVNSRLNLDAMGKTWNYKTTKDHPF
jgi:hypothetical protein